MPISGPLTYIAGGIVAVLVAMNAYQWVVNAKLSLDFSHCETETAQLRADKTIARLEVSGLKAVIGEQNGAIDKLVLDSKVRESKAIRAQAAAVAQKAHDMAEIVDLAAQEGASCSEGMALINQELGL